MQSFPNRFNKRAWNSDTKSYRYIECPPVTSIQQSTGHIDLNNTEIYEGDILTVDRGSHSDTFVVCFTHYNSPSTGLMYANFEVYPILEYPKQVVGNPIPAKCTVIGNINQNPELLKLSRWIS